MNDGAAIHLAAMSRVQRSALAVGLIASAICIAGAFFTPGAQFFHSYLFAFLYWLGIALGSCAVVMLYHLTGGQWGLITRRVLESGARTLPLMALLVVPLLFGVPYLYEWAHSDAVAHDPLLQHKSVYLNLPFFVGRTLLYFAVWLALAFFLNKWSRQQDATGDPDLARKMRALSAPGLVLYGLTGTFAAVDWVMSLEPHWFSTVYGLLFMVGQVLTTFAFAIMIAMWLVSREPLARVATKKGLNDLGNLLMAFVLLWAYLAFSQFLIIWSGNLPEEIVWYRQRLRDGWAAVAVFLIVFHFAIPFAVLLSRDVKRKARTLGAVAAAMLLIRLVDLFWVVEPSRGAGLGLHWMDVLIPVGMGGIWLWAFAWQLKKQPLVPLNDPELPVEG
jgi:hypothetical protein